MAIIIPSGSMNSGIVFMNGIIKAKKGALDNNIAKKAIRLILKC